ncbi:MAG: gamma-glutamyl-gamma-aminobutyrate hydrolase family protein [Lachnospiraceae bacterium]|jgi:putative glutamine amidotransferase|nr:gamma-glutamyl-gamma-aminobutyrate hydrolase family protein [Lachnospiraceae bacterium]
MKKILIAGYPEKTVNYEKALTMPGVFPQTDLNVPYPDEYDALVLPGGDDIDPVLFGQLNNGSRTIDRSLDRIQLMLLKEFVLRKKPILGICKGMQIINVFFGGDIIQHLDCHATHEYIGHDQAHGTLAREHSFLANLYCTHFTVNSAHHQGCGTPGRHLSYIQFAEDGTVEGLRHDTLPIIGVQWHPERMVFRPDETEMVDGRRLITYFIQMIPKGLSRETLI